MVKLSLQTMLKLFFNRNQVLALSQRHHRGDLKMRQMLHCGAMKCVYLQTLWETLFPIIKTPTPTVKYGGHCLRYGHTLVGKNYLLFHIMEDTAPDNAVRIRSVHEAKTSTDKQSGSVFKI